MCIDIHAAKNTEARHVHMWSCHNGWNQRFEVQYRQLRKSTGIKTKKRFQIRSVGGRVLYVDRHVGGGQYQVKIRSPRFDNKEFFIFDARSGHIRWASNRRYALAPMRNRAIKGAYMCVRIAKNTPLQKFAVGKSNARHNFQSISNRRMCMDIWWGKNRDGNPVGMYNCHNGWNQKWAIVPKMVFKSTGLKAGKPFQIKSIGGKVMYYNEHIGNAEYRMRIRDPRYDYREFWIYDAKTGHIRWLKDRRYVLSTYRGSGNRGSPFVMKFCGGRYASQCKTPFQKWAYTPGKKHNWSPMGNKKMCIDIHAARNTEARHLHMWTCHNGWNQRFEV